MTSTSQRHPFTWVFRNSVRLAVFGVFSIVLGIALYFAKEHVDPQSEPVTYFTLDFLYSLLKELGFALLIAVAIIEGIERVARLSHNEEIRRQIAEIKENLLRSIYGKNIDQGFFTVFEQFVLREPLVRELSTLRLRLSCKDSRIDSESVAMISASHFFRLRNTSGESREFALPLALEKPWPELAERAGRTSRVTSIKIRHPEHTHFETISVDEVDKAATDDPDFTRFKYVERIPAGGYVEIILEYELLKFARDSAVFLSNLPALEFKVELDYDPQFEVCYSSIHMRDFVNESPSEAFNSLVLRPAGPLLPSNGVEYWWRPRRCGAASVARDGDAALQAPRRG